jgi:hypothetical protein
MLQHGSLRTRAAVATATAALRNDSPNLECRDPPAMLFKSESRPDVVESMML